MKTAILLLVGAAVIGPIDAREECTSFGAPSGRACRAIETLPELCARAMRETGAQQWPFEAGAWDRLRPGAWYLGDPMQDDYEIVRCIREPEGYRR